MLLLLCLDSAVNRRLVRQSAAVNAAMGDMMSAREAYRIRVCGIVASRGEIAAMLELLLRLESAQILNQEGMNPYDQRPASASQNEKDCLLCARSHMSR